MNFQDSNVEKSPTLERLVFVPKWLLSLIVCAAAACGQAKVEYIGGTAPQIAVGASGAITVSDTQYFAFYSRKSNVRVAYDKINLLEYGQTVSRRIDLAIILEMPAFLLVKKRKHYLSIGYNDEDGKQQALVFRVDKNDIRALLVSLEARTGQKVQYQDEEARKAGRG
jgi:hypothetical protein